MPRRAPGTPVENCTHRIPHVHGENRTERAGCCRCTTCVAARRQYDRDRQNTKRGRAEKVPAHLTQAHILMLIDTGSTVRRIATESGVGADTVSRIRVGKAKLTTRPVHDLITAVQPAAGLWEGRVPATASVRRLRHLALMGWSTDTVAAAAGLNPKHIEHIRDERFAELREPTAAGVEKATRHLLTRTPPPTRATKGTATRARNKGWVSLFAYDNLDDPNETPNITPLTRAGKDERAARRIGDLTDLLAAGIPAHQAVIRAGYPNTKAAYQAAQHKGLTDLTEHLLDAMSHERKTAA